MFYFKDKLLLKFMKIDTETVKCIDFQSEAMPTWKMVTFYIQFSFILINTVIVCKSDVEATKMSYSEYVPLLEDQGKSKEFDDDAAVSLILS